MSAVLQESHFFFKCKAGRRRKHQKYALAGISQQGSAWKCSICVDPGNWIHLLLSKCFDLKRRGGVAKFGTMSGYFFPSEHFFSIILRMRKLCLMKIQVSKMPMYDSTEEMDHLRSRLAAAEQQQVGSAGTMCHRRRVVSWGILWAGAPEVVGCWIGGCSGVVTKQIWRSFCTPDFATAMFFSRFSTSVIHKSILTTWLQQTQTAYLCALKNSHEFTARFENLKRLRCVSVCQKLWHRCVSPQSRQVFPTSFRRFSFCMEPTFDMWVYEVSKVFRWNTESIRILYS